MVSKNPSRWIYRGAAAAVLFLAVSTLTFTSTRAQQHRSSSQPHRAATATPPDPAAQAREVKANAFVRKALHTWQDRMNLTDWKIDVKLVRANVLEPDTLGNIHWDTTVKRASIEVLSSYDYPMAEADMLKDMEFTVVHELVHLDLASLPRSKASRRVEEHAVNQLADALLKLADQNQK
jgi:hypothetical protein